MTTDQIPLCAKQVLEVLKKCQKIAKYVKKASINNHMKEDSGGILHQSCTVRWLSMSNILESLLKSLKQTKRLLLATKKQSLVNDLNETTVKQLILFLKPYKHIMTLIQTGQCPSLYMILLCTLTLNDTLSSYESLIKYKRNYRNPNEKNIDNELKEDEEYEDYELPD
ncbi:unnamed protein product [Adineta steineri]|uniref:Uncharacterized protein n=1 Tax=Adineta steineri TaxID=433720 RepID=A0A819ZFL0_9BILA|nr:unnamed protein product [Adineta steineri]CAF4167840.1 unnamed protein product [Adineta steineri]